VRTGGGGVVVELAGLAGAGKSTLARELAADPTVRLGVPLSRVRSALAQGQVVARFAIPYLAEAAGSAWFDRDQLRGAGYLRAWLRPLARARSQEHVLVLDHGPLFRLAQLDAFGPPLTSTPAFARWRDAMIEAYARRLDAIVWLDAPDDLLVRRIRTREQRHVLRGADDESAHLFLERYRASYTRIVEQLDQRAPGRVLSLRTDGDPPEMLARQVRRHLGLEAAQLDV
jgi:shikimate kinase